MREIFPLAGILGQDSLVDALLVNAIDPGVGGLLIRGEKGTAKSTAARGLAALLPPLQVVAGSDYNCNPDNLEAECPEYLDTDYEIEEIPVPFVELPLGATEDRVLGTLDFERALQEGRRAFQPGLLAAAHRGILYIDEVNLLPDHLVDVLLDAAAMGVNTVQREGVSVTHPSQFILVGTMNPEEGDLRPQLLDRFGLMVEVEGPQEVAIRKEIVRRRIAFDDNPDNFREAFAEQEAHLRDVIIGGREQLEIIQTPETIYDLIARICLSFDVDGMRADIYMHRTARAVAALFGRDQVAPEDVRMAAEWVLPHRRRRQPFEQPGLDHQKLNNLMRESLEEEPGSPEEDSPPKDQGPNQQGPDSATGTPASDNGKRTAHVAEQTQSIKQLELRSSDALARRQNGRRNRTDTRKRGHYVRARRSDSPTDFAIDATLRSAASRGLSAQGGLIIRRSDLHEKVRKGKVGSLILFAVDGSGSMAARKRMEAVKGAVLSLLLDAYQQRDKVGLITFYGAKAQLVLPPTNSVDLAERAIRDLDTGGRTPLAHALMLAEETLRKALHADPDLLTLFILLSDGKGNVSVRGLRGGPLRQAYALAERIGMLGVPSLMIDVKEKSAHAHYARKLATSMHGQLMMLNQLSAESLVLTVKRMRYTAQA